jgi:transposase InsO family protein
VNAWTTTLSPGLALCYDGEQFTVAEVEGRRVLLRQEESGLGPPRWRQVDIGVLLAHPTTRFLVAEPGEEPACASVLGALSRQADDALTVKFRHVQEVCTGYQLGSPDLALEGEPRAEYAAGVSMMRRYAAKAEELGVSESTIRNWTSAARRAGPAGLVTGRAVANVLDRVDHRWVDAARSALAGHVGSSRPVRRLLLIEVEERLAEVHGRGVVPVPARTVAYLALRELARGTNAFEGSTKGKRSIANRPQGVYGRLRATRPGEYVLLDTTRLDVFAMEPVTCRWVQAELTVAMDLYSRCITAVRLTPVSTKAVDVAAVLFETVRPRSGDGPRAGTPLPYGGVPSVVVVDGRRLVDADGGPLLAPVAVETIVFDHGKVFLSNHIQSVCAKFGISLQPCRPFTPTDKSPLERWFKTLSEGLLAALPGYKGADVHSRGEAVEEQAFFFLDELEAIIREWTALVYHCGHHRGLVVPEVPGLKLSPLEMFEHGVTRAGPLVIPTRPQLALEFLEEVWCTVQHYGVELGGLRYNGPGLDPYRNRRSAHGGAHAGKWPVAVDSGDVTRVYFQDPGDHRWHVLAWEHAAALNGPVSREAVAYARRLAARTERFPDTRRALVELLERWGAGLAGDRTERRMALRLSQERLLLAGETQPAQEPDVVGQLPSVRRITSLAGGSPALAGHAVDAGGDGDAGGDDDEEGECQAGPERELAGDGGQEDFYAGVWESR